MWGCVPVCGFVLPSLVRHVYAGGVEKNSEGNLRLCPVNQALNWLNIAIIQLVDK